ncbi:MAG TPA: hypothetical protein VGX68_06990 [Thermoanaerobaculia bacterium]|nr:hypothetical protein [Thermoanaerobaculia bacterium]
MTAFLVYQDPPRAALHASGMPLSVRVASLQTFTAAWDTSDEPLYA